MTTETDPITGRPYGDHGSAADAIEFALDDPKGLIDGDAYNLQEFLESWRDGGAWLEYYVWLRETGR